jgi:hypothetical protein
MGKDKKLCVDVQMQDLHILDFLNNHAQGFRSKSLQINKV